MNRSVIHPVQLGVGLAITLGWLAVGAIAEVATARSDLKNANGVKVGEASLQDTTEGVRLSATFTDLPPGQHAFHVHAMGRCEPPFESAGVHFNPTQRQHGRDNPQGSHAGDMPNIEVTDRKAAKIEVVLRDVTLVSGPNRLLGSDGASLVVHERADDYVSDPAGDAGARIACGVISAR